MRIRFIKNFDFRRSETQVVAYKTGMIVFVDQLCADAAVRAGRAVPISLDPPPFSLVSRIPKASTRVEAG